MSTTTAPDPLAVMDTAIDRALQLAFIVRAGTVADVSALLDPLDEHEQRALIVALAGAVDVDRSPAELYAEWDTPRDPADLWPEDERKRAHSAFNCGDRSPWAMTGERAYQTVRGRRRRAAAREAARA